MKIKTFKDKSIKNTNKSDYTIYFVNENNLTMKIIYFQDLKILKYQVTNCRCFQISRPLGNKNWKIEIQ